jgi:flavin-dependent dehydrogenase
LNRAAFHKNIADAAQAAGVECHYDVLIQKLEKTESGWNVSVIQGKEAACLSARTIIDASGPGCRLTRNIPCLEGIESGDTDLETGIFAVADGIEHSPEHIELFFGSEFKDGYGWIFPRDGKEVNIGFVLGKSVKNDEPLRQKLMNFITKNYPNATVKAVYGGMIACGQSDKPLAKSGLFKAGDAASCVNPISRSGIVESLISGKIAAEAVDQWLKDSGENRSAIEASALTRWMDALGKSHKQIAQAKAGFNSITDNQLDKAAKRLSRLPREKQTLVRIFWNVLWSCPSVIWKMRSFLH